MLFVKWIEGVIDYLLEDIVYENCVHVALLTKINKFFVWPHKLSDLDDNVRYQKKLFEWNMTNKDQVKVSQVSED